MKKAVVVYYSYSGNTKKVALILQKELSAHYQTEIIPIEALDEPDSFLRQCLRALKKKQAKIKENISFNIKDYDLVALGTPVWAFGMAPAMRTFMDKSNGFEAKDIIVFATYGSGVGKEKCLKEMAQISISKGAADVKQFLVQQNDAVDEQIIKSRIKEIL